MLALGKSQTLSVHWHTLLPSLLAPGGHVLDLGANVGSFSSEIAHRFGCTCHAVEPDPELRAHIVDGPLVHTYGYAMAGRRATASLRRGANTLAASIVGEGDGGAMEVETIDLASFLEAHVDGPVALVKMDIEGAEIQMLDATPDAVLASIPQLSVEFHDFCGLTPAAEVRRVARRLEGLGFHYLRMSGVGHQDTLFVHRRLAPFARSDALATRLVTRNARGLRRVVRRMLGLPPRP